MAQNIAYIPEPTAKNYYGSATGTPATEVLLSTYTVPAGQTAIIKSVYGEGGTDGIFKLYVNSVVIWQDRNAWTQRGVSNALEKSIVAGDVVDLKVTNQKTVNHTFTGGFYVYEL